MNDGLTVGAALFLLLCTSMYLGTGWSLVLFSFPTADALRTDNYYSHFVPQVEAATRFFTVMTGLMLVAGGVLLVTEWDSPRRWVPVVVLAGVVAATLLTTRYILPFNREMKAGITDEARLRHTLSRWMRLNRVRVALWTVQWVAMAAWFTWFAVR
ncbi:hypothetical protein [Egicoccus sp. AB-alg6-2]|uniref:hypothetical protein n=1 Tax=Egicoccus sp. AB-alg6-2 TaxID=3242692 RepID=UPI00359E9BA5